MRSGLKNFIRNYVELPETELEAIAQKFIARTLRKKEFLLRQGDTCKDLVYVQKGCLRLFYLKDGIEISVWFAMEHSSAIEIYSFISEKPSRYFIQAIEDTEILYLPKVDLTQLYSSHPKMQELIRRFWEDVILNLIKRFTALQTDSAEKRYQDLLEQPAYFHSIPQKYLASFIGVTPTSLSRIRKQIKNKMH